MRCVRVVQEYRVNWFEMEPVIRQLFDGALLCRRRLQCRPREVRRRGGHARRDRRSGIFQRQIKHEGAAFARRAAQMNFSAEQAREFAADGKTKTSTAV